MKISFVEIENFRCHCRTEISVSDYHVLVGENGSGKTAILEAINYATSPYFLASRFDEMDFNNNDAGDIRIRVKFDSLFVVKVPDGYASQMIPCDQVELSVKRRQKAASGKVFSDGFVVSHLCSPIFYHDKRDLKTVPLPNDVSYDDLPSHVSTTENGIELLRKTGSKMKLRLETVSMTNELIGFPEVFYFDRAREKETKIGFNSLLTKLAKDLNWRYRKEWSRRDAMRDWLTYYDSVVATVEDKKKREILGPLREAVSKLLGSDFSSLELSLLNVEQPFSKAFLSLRENSNQIDLGGVGSGVSMIIALALLELIGAMSGQNLIFLIDEPEMHLHPQLQSRLFEHFESSDAQTMVSSHSPLFLNLAKWRGITRFSREGTYPTARKLNEKLGAQPVREHLDDISRWYYHETTLSPQDNEVFFARKVLLVEGPAEKYGLPRLANTLSIVLPHLTIISCNGKGKIPHYATLCQAFEIPTFVLFDLDGEPTTEAQNQKIFDSAKGLDVLHFDTSFEAALGVRANAEHKASKVLARIDGITKKEEVPEEIVAAIEMIAEWCAKA